MSSVSVRVRAQYEDFPYPPYPSFVLPQAEQAPRVAWERGRELMGAPQTHDGKRILVAGCGTLEAALVAIAHPRAREIVAVDLSERSIQRLQRRLSWARWTRPWRYARGLPPIRCVAADLWQWRDGEFDYVIASNVLHHVADPSAMLERLAGFVRPGGLMRVVTYPAASRFWLRRVGEWLRWHGVRSTGRSIAARAWDVVSALPNDHPIRLCFESHSESRSSTGIVDAFLHACEYPLSPLRWANASRKAGLELIGEDQHELSCGDLLLKLQPQTSFLSPWERIEVLDRTLELSTNPVWWFVKQQDDASRVPLALPPRPVANTSPPNDMLTESRAFGAVGEGTWQLPSSIFFELSRHAYAAEHVLARAHIHLGDFLNVLRSEIGTHHSSVDQRELPGLALSDYPMQQLRRWHAPWGDVQWEQFERHAGGALSLYYKDQRVPGENLLRQARWLQLRYGARTPMLEVRLRPRAQPI